MMKASKIILACAGCLLALGLSMTMGPARTTLAQEKPLISLESVLVKPVDLPPPVPESSTPAKDLPPPVQDPPAKAVEPPLPSLPPAVDVRVPSPEMLKVSEGGSPPSTIPAVKPSVSASIADDPEKVAREFVEKNKKVAETELVALKKEAEALRSRLKKVESAMRRWEAVSHALKQSEGVASKVDGSWKVEGAMRQASMIPDDEPSNLEPIETKSPIHRPDTILP